MTKDIALRQEELVSSIDAARQAFENARRGFRATRIATAESLDTHSAKLKATFGEGLDLFDRINEMSAEALEEALQRAAQRQAAIAEALVYGLHEMTAREIASAATMVPNVSSHLKKDINLD